MTNSIEAEPSNARKRGVSLTTLAVPIDLFDRASAEAASDLRTYKAELLVLIAEAIDARDKKKARA